MDDNMMDVLKAGFQGVWQLMMKDLHFPAPLGDISPFEIMAFYGIAHILATLIVGIGQRRRGDDE